MVKSWKTTLLGIGSLLGIAADVIRALIDGDPLTNPDWTLVFAGATAAIGLIFARDNDKSSEDVGAK